MALTKKDVNTIREALKPDFDQLNKKIDMQTKTLISSWKEVIEELYGKRSVNERVDNLEVRVDKLERKDQH